MTLRDWFWQLQAAAHGPDWYFFASFAPADDAPLAALVERLPPPGFARYRAGDHDIYIDERNYAALAANYAGANQHNIWIYHTITVRGADLAIERGYGGYPNEHGDSETGLILALAATGDPLVGVVALAGWSVAYGGEGYDSGQVAAGAGPDELRAYLEDG